MKLVICLLLVIIFLLPTTIFAKTVRVRGGFTKSGTYRQPHYRTSPSKTKLDNWSTKGSVNPFTGKRGTKNPYKVK